MRKVLLISAFLFLPCLFLQAQNPFIRHYTTPDGLPSNAINIIRQDHEKFLWFATRGGLVRYDGSTFKSYDIKDGLLQNKVMAIKEDSHQRVWFFLIGSQVSYFHQNKIYNEKNTPFLDSLRGNWNFVEDRQGNLYFYNYHHRRICVLDTNNHIKSYMLPSESVDNTITSDGMNIQYLTRIPSGEYLIWTYTGIFKTKDLSQKPEKILHFDRFHNIQAINDTSMYDISDGPTSNSSILVKYIEGIPTDTIIFNESALNVDAMIMEDANGNVWISSTEKGLYCLENKKIIYHLALEGISWICQDHEGHIWAISDGAYRISPYVLLFKHYDNSFFDNSGIGALSADPQGQIWGLAGNKVFLFKNNEFYTRDFSYLGKDFADLDALNDHSLIIYNYDIITSGSFAITGISTKPPDRHLVFDKAIPFQWKFNQAGPVYNKNRDKLSIYDVNNQFVAIYSVQDQFREIDRVQVGYASHVFYDARDKLVVLEYKGDYILQNGEKIPDKEFARLSRALPVQHETLDSNADVFRSMFDSLYLVKDMKAFNLTSSFDYSINTPIQWMTYQNPVLYLSTFRNIFACDNPLNIEENKAVPLHLIDINFSDILDIQVAHDSLFVASGDGLTIIPVKQIGQIRSQVPLPYFRSIKLNDQDVGLNSGGMNVKGNNKLSFEFGSINYSDNPAQYSYMIQGYDEDWNTGSMKSVVYANLPRGHYKFLLRAGKTNSPWSDPIGYDITIKATFWQLPIFYICLSLALASLISLVVIYRKSSQMKKREIEHQLVTLEQKALQSMMNPHFLFNALGSIQNYLLQNKPGEAGLYLSQFARLIRQNISSIHSAMISLEAEIDRLKNYLDLEKLRMANRFNYKIEIDKNLEEDDVLIPSMITQPFVENSILHGISPLGSGGLIIISFKMVSEKALRIIIEDNGVGIKQSKAFKPDDRGHLHMSMEMTRKRIEILGQKYKVKTSVEVTNAVPGTTNPGTRVTLVLPVIFGEEQ